MITNVQHQLRARTAANQGPPGLESVTYPNNRVVQYDYNDGPQAAIDEVMSRLGSITNAPGTPTRTRSNGTWASTTS